MDFKEKTKELLCAIGIEYQSDSDELLMDSIQFISLIVLIENEFNIEVPDDLLNITILNTIDKLVTVMDNLVGEGSLYEKRS